jgi:molybdopterin-guanine dinucleotide biosynthesis protein A
MPVGIVLAGGLGNRIGRDKAGLPWGESDLLHVILEQMGQVCQERIVVMNRVWTPDIAGVTVVPDIIPQCGPLSGIHAGLSACREPYAFVTACDMPFLSPQAVEYLLSLANDWDAVLPGRGQELEPLFAVYNRRCIEPIEGLLRQGTRKLQRLLPLIRHRLVDQDEFRRFDPQLKLFYNINTPEDYQAARNEP